MYVIQRRDGFLADREAIAVWLRRSVHTIRKRCVVVERTAHGTPLYNMEHCEGVLAAIGRRPWQDQCEVDRRSTGML